MPKLAARRWKSATDISFVCHCAGKQSHKIAVVPTKLIAAFWWMHVAPKAIRDAKPWIVEESKAHFDEGRAGDLKHIQHDYLRAESDCKHTHTHISKRMPIYEKKNANLQASLRHEATAKRVLVFFLRKAVSVRVAISTPRRLHACALPRAQRHKSRTRAVVGALAPGR